MLTAGVILLVLIVLAAVGWGRKAQAGINDEKRELLRPLEGQYDPGYRHSIRCHEDGQGHRH